MCGYQNVQYIRYLSYFVQLRIATPPVADLSAVPGPHYVGDLVTLDASRSSDSTDPIGDYKWDLTGNGSYTTDTGTTPTETVTVEHTGALTVGVQVTNQAGLTATTTITIPVYPAPPGGVPGVSIDHGAVYTNTPYVTLSFSWPRGRDSGAGVQRWWLRGRHAADARSRRIP